MEVGCSHYAHMIKRDQESCHLCLQPTSQPVLLLELGNRLLELSGLCITEDVNPQSRRQIVPVVAVKGIHFIEGILGQLEH